MRYFSKGSSGMVEAMEQHLPTTRKPTSPPSSLKHPTGEAYSKLATTTAQVIGRQSSPVWAKLGAAMTRTYAKTPLQLQHHLVSPHRSA